MTAPFGRRLATVAGVQSVGAYRLLVVADPDGPEPLAGQFAMLASAQRWGGGEDERPYLPRALSVAGQQQGRASFLLEDVGPGTHRLCEAVVGEEVWVVGPLGVGFTMPPAPSRAILVGGGVGIAPLMILQQQLARARRVDDRLPPTVLVGFRDGPHARGASLLADARVATDDGAVGHHGRVTDLLADELDSDPRAVVYACGPPAMLEAVRAMCELNAVPGQLALEAGMACGFGACHGCVVPTRDGGYLRVCLDGPVVDAQALARVSGPGSHERR